MAKKSKPFKQAKRRRNTIAADLHTKKYQQRIVKSKKVYDRKSKE